MQVQVYLLFAGRCEEAVEFYKQAIGAEVMMLMRFKESPDQPPPGMLPPGSEDKIMHACLRIGDTIVMASDGQCGGAPTFQGFSLSVSVASEREADRVFGALAEGGQIQMPLGKTFWSPRFGMLTDRFGVGWMVNVAPSPAS
ncbi:MAG TPA: VOC family protein [Candidatus Eisenbacteria bacterium]|nr:VOC family protein [Candidatus Eisenbacteria bacterium]